MNARIDIVEWKRVDDEPMHEIVWKAELNKKTYGNSIIIGKAGDELREGLKLIVDNMIDTMEVINGKNH